MECKDNRESKDCKENRPRGILEQTILAGIGAMAVTAEKSKEVLDELVKKGELTIEQGKAINEELKRQCKAAMEETSRSTQEFATSTIIDHLDKLSPEERAQILAKLKELEKPENCEESDNCESKATCEDRY